ncbi:MAG: mannitol dehydrogenase family protein [Pseudomonadales bacterium]|jgi:mannitol 2-dehydrogenase
MKLNNNNLVELKGAILPSYDRDDLSAGILHIGLGNFHRAHQAWYLHRLMQQRIDLDWAIVGAGVRSSDEQMRVKLAQQDFLTSLIELDPKSTVVEIVGSMIDFVPVNPRNQTLIERMVQNDIRIVSLTVTESGYFLDGPSKGFNASHIDIIHDVAYPQQPVTCFGAIIEALRQRRQHGLGPFTIMSCDNLLGNGDITKQTVLSLARLQDAELADWIEHQVTFPNSMVDCIVPATGPQEMQLITELGIDDQAPVTHEPYRQWVIEDNFCAGRPQWEKVGVTITENVHAYETMKLRILNGGHQVIAAAGDLIGIETIAGCMSDAKISGLFFAVEQEIAPHVPAVPEFTPQAYIELIAQRFANSKIFDTTRRVAYDGSSRQPGFLMDSIRDSLKLHTGVNGLALVSAIWARYCQGVREDGSKIKPNDPHWSLLCEIALRAKTTPIVWLENVDVYGNLAENKEFSNAFCQWLEMINSQGLILTINNFLPAKAC